MTKLHGVITSMLTPFTQNLNLDEETLAQEIEYQLDAEVHGICVLGGTGESLSLSLDEREKVVRITVELVKGRIPVIVGCFLPQEEELVSFANRVQELGATAMMLTSPPFYKLTALQFQCLLERISQQSSLPLVLYNAPKRAGVSFTAQEVCGLVSQVPSVIGLKDAAGGISDLAKIGQGMDARASLLQGMDDIFLPTLAVGGAGGILAMATPVPEILVGIYEDWKTGAVEKAVSQQLDLVPVMSAVNREPMPVLVKEAMNVVGRPMGATRPPLYGSSEENRRELRVAMEKLLSLAP